ncbi:MAG: hypothetical protein ACYCTI_02255 [Acidimicrobiales bacterium]
MLDELAVIKLAVGNPAVGQFDGVVPVDRLDGITTRWTLIF